MLQQAIDFKDESDSLAALLSDRGDDIWFQKTLFKKWSLCDIIGHLYMFNVAADLTLESGDRFDAFFADISKALGAGKSLLDVQYEWLEGLNGRKLFDRWCESYPKTAETYRNIDPKTRLRWAGPDMSATSCITARQMETWSHGQAVFDLLGVIREDSDRLKNIAHLGASTYRWAFVNRGDTPPEPKPYIKLIAPSGAIWEWNQEQADNYVSGSATEFCQTVAQTRNVADTEIKAVGDIAQKWMSIAQCFAGPPQDPPEKGARYKQS